MSAAPLQPGERRLHEHPEAGQFYVSYFVDHPRGRPFFANGRYYASEQEAVDGFFAQCAPGVPTDDELAPMDRYAAESRVADRIDGYDRDDLGESPDF